MPAPAPARMSELSQRCFVFIRFTVRTSCLWMVRGPAYACTEMAASDTFKNDPVTFIELMVRTRIFSPARREFRFAQDAALSWASEVQQIPRMHIRVRRFRIRAPVL